jgi:hypothetical protein
MNKEILDKILVRTKLESALNEEGYESILSEITSSDDDDEYDSSNPSTDIETMISSPSVIDILEQHTGIDPIVVNNNSKLLASVRLELQQKKLELDKIHREYQTKISDIQESYEAERHASDIEVIKLKSILQRFV